MPAAAVPRADRSRCSALALGIVVVQRDLGAALLFYAVFLALLYVATGRLTDVVLGLLLFAAGFALLALLFPHVQQRIAIWLDPCADPLGDGYQLIQALHAFARGGLLGTGLGAGLPEIGGRLPIPAVHTDFPLAALGEELGHRRGRRHPRPPTSWSSSAACGSPPSPRDDFRALLAAGLALVVGVQAVDHRRRQPQAHPADRDHAPVRQLRRLVAAGERARRRAAARPLGPRRRRRPRRRVRRAWPGCRAWVRRAPAGGVGGGPRCRASGRWRAG